MPVWQILLNLPFLIPGFLIKYLFFVKKGLGSTYRKGIFKGIKLCASEEGRGKKIPFQWKNLANYLRIQWKLWGNTVRRFVG